MSTRKEKSEELGARHRLAKLAAPYIKKQKVKVTGLVRSLSPDMSVLTQHY